MELDPLYCDVIVQRWEKFACRKSELIAIDADHASLVTAGMKGRRA